MKWRISDRPFSDYPEGTFARSGMGGYWIKTHRGKWKWCNSDCSFPRPGGDWNGMVWVPEETVIKESELVTVGFTFGTLRYRIFTDSKYSEHPFDSFIAGWFDLIEEVKEMCEYYRKGEPGNVYKIGVFSHRRGDLIGFLEH